MQHVQHRPEGGEPDGPLRVAHSISAGGQHHDKRVLAASDELTAVAGGSFVVEHTDDKHRAQVVHRPQLLVVVPGGL